MSVQAVRKKVPVDRDERLARIPCAIIRSGTSRFIVVSRPNEQQLGRFEDALLRAMLGDTPEDALGGDHYQSNKIVVLHRCSESGEVPFHFYQVDKDHHRLFPDMECANGAAAAGMFHLLNEGKGAQRQGRIRFHNLGTGQWIDVFFSPDSMSRVSDWKVRFVFGAQNDEIVHFLGTHMFPKGVSSVRIVQQGNLFLLVEAKDTQLSLSDVAAIESLAQTEILARGQMVWPQAGLKTIVYRIEAKPPGDIPVSVRCYFGGNMHHSIPGSGAICLTRTLTRVLLETLPPQRKSGSTRFDILHPRGSTIVTTRWKFVRESFVVDEGSFQTPVRLLFSGELLLAM